MIVCNGNLTPESKKRLETCTKNILIRDNIGFDMEAWRQGILNQNLAEYDELILFNDSFYGLFYPAENIFAEMDSKYPNADFWGLTIHGKTEDSSGMSPYGYIPEHIQSYFIVVRKRMLHSLEFLRYWKEAKISKTFDEAIMQHEVCFTKKFFDKGFNYAVYCDTRTLEKEYKLRKNNSILNAYKLLKDYKCPVLKKKVFLVGRNIYLHETYSDEPLRSFDFIKNYTNYNSDLIWQNLLRKQNIACIKENLGLNYILPNQVPLQNFQPDLNKTVIIAHLYYEDLISECVEYLCNAPREISIIVTVNNEEKKFSVEEAFKRREREVEVRLVSNRGRDLSALLVGCADVFKQYKYLCFIHDKKSIRDNESEAVGRSFFQLLWENTLAGENFIKNVLSAFESEPRLGLMVPPRPYHGRYRFLLFFEKYWSKTCFEKTLELAEKFGIPKHFIKTEYASLSIGSVFWCRTAALEKLFGYDWKIEDFPDEPMPVEGTLNHALERIFPFVAQSSEFYTGELINSEFARNELENFIFFAFNPQAAPVGFSPILIAIQFLKYFIKSNVPTKYWRLLYPFKHLLEKFGFKV